MADAPTLVDWSALAAGFLTTVTTSAVLAWLFRRSQGRASRSPTTDAQVLRYAPVLRPVFATQLLLFPGLLAAILWLDPPSRWEPPWSEWILVAIFGSFALVAAAGLLETLTLRVEVSPRGVQIDSPWSGVRTLAWNEIVEVGYSPAMMWFTLRGRDGTRIRVSRLLRGIPDLARALRAHLEPRVFEAATPHLESPILR